MPRTLAAAAPEGSRQDHGDTVRPRLLSVLRDPEPAGRRADRRNRQRSAMPVWRTAEEILPVVETTRPAHVQAAFRARAPPSA